VRSPHGQVGHCKLLVEGHSPLLYREFISEMVFVGGNNRQRRATNETGLELDWGQHHKTMCKCSQYISLVAQWSIALVLFSASWLVLWWSHVQILVLSFVEKGETHNVRHSAEYHRASAMTLQ